MAEIWDLIYNTDTLAIAKKSFRQFSLVYNSKIYS